MLLSLLALAAPAHAFCGTYVGQAGASLYNNASQVVIARQGTRTTLTLANDYEGDATAFALLVPVPEVLGPDDVTVVDPELFTRLDAYSAPRLVSYTCEDLHPAYDTADMADSDSDGASGPPADGSVTVEATFAAGEYDIVVLSAEDSSGLLRWLDTNGYGVDDAAAALLGEYIDAGAYFFAAKVALDRLPEGSSYLSPLRFGYESEVFSLPIRLGTLNSSGIQDLVVYAVNGQAEGAVGVSNYPEATIEHECMYRADEYATFAELYGAQFGAAMASQERAAWVREYAWSAGGCDPCSGTPPSEEDLAAVGYTGSPYEAFFTRLHMRYGPGDADQDLVLYPSNDASSSQLRYIVYDQALEADFPVCGVGWVEGGGTCDDEGGPAEDTDGGALTGGAPACGCASSGAPGAFGALAAAMLLARRRARKG
jgi:MYXO-CTERM domain-containing protein